jgi:hypothetical protein
MRVRRGMSSPLLVLVTLALSAALVAGCSDGATGAGSGGGGSGGAAGGSGGASGGSGGSSGATSSTGGGGGAGGGGSGGAVDPGPMVDTSDPQLYEAKFTAAEADPAAGMALGTQLAHLDTTVASQGILVVYLHGAGAPSTCGSGEHGKVLASLGFHVLAPCYVSDYGVGNCGDDIEGCRLEAFDGADHHAFVDIGPEDSIEARVVKGLEYLQKEVPQGDWTYFLDGDQPRWSKIVISGISHGASTSAVIGIHRDVRRVVSLSGPLDSGQAWLMKPPMTPIDRFYAFSHTADSQHAGHLQSFEDMGLPGEPAPVDGESPPYGGNHRLITSATTNDGHTSTQAGGSSPKDASSAYLYLPVWQTMYQDQAP